ncbi:hypothetical protein CLU79DRAFT_832609 [Phycomyces nitens]|nr:hypothetical protein CLU79DRAFT_832609 [Phycomyces nitens]
MKASYILAIVAIFAAVASADRSQEAVGVGNKGTTSGLFNNKFKGGFAADNGVDNKVSQDN